MKRVDGALNTNVQMIEQATGSHVGGICTRICRGLRGGERRHFFCSGYFFANVDTSALELMRFGRVSIYLLDRQVLVRKAGKRE